MDLPFLEEIFTLIIDHDECWEILNLFGITLTVMGSGDARP
jgi:hypothetical protein